MTWFDPSRDWDWEEGELEKLLENEKGHPDRYRTMDHSVGTMKINGKEIVTGCGCDHARAYEAFLIDDAERIAEYLNRRGQELREQADKITVK
jgi:Zn-finger nucleic acid-binding protein